MSAASDFYLERAADCARDAGKAELANVRDRFLSAEAAWRAMAERILSTEAARDRNAAEKAALIEQSGEYTAVEQGPGADF